MFVSLEGIDGCGKTTQAGLLADALGDTALRVREPGGAAAAEQMREILIDPDLPLDPLAELMLFCSARAQVVAEVIRPALEAGKVVVCDRFSDSTVAYQGLARGLGVEQTRQACEIATGGLWPDLTIYLEIDPEVAGGRTDGGDRFENEGLDFQRAVADGYRVLADSEPDRIHVVDANRSQEEIAVDVMAEVEVARLRVADR